jgi:carboxypeptidase T
MRRFLLFALMTLLAGLAGSALAADGPHDLILLRLDSPGAEAFLNENRGKLDITLVKPGQYAEIAVTAETMQLVRDSGLAFEVLTRNMEETYASRQKGDNFGIWHTYSESAAFQDSLRLLYPHVISEKWSIGQSVEGRDIWAFRVSDNPDVDEDEPEILIDGMHHAREIMASEFGIMFAEYLAQNYGTDPEITWLLDNRELYIVPIVNPDGVVYNESTYPNGGGMWRKNRRYNGDGTYGVDINRNYPYMWAYDNWGSSPYTSDATYRGPFAGSEPETQAMVAFVNGRNFITHDSIHTYSNLLLYPWGYTANPTPDEAIFQHMAEEMTRYNGYEAGQPGEVLYDVNGGTFDWVYGDTAHHERVLSFSSEIGGSGDGFWPDESRRGPLFQENIWPHVYLMRVAGPFIAVHSPVVTGPALGIDPGQSGNLDFTVENQSVVASALNVQVTVRCDDPWVQFGSAEFDLGDLASMQSTNLGSGALPVMVDPACPDGHLVDFVATVNMADGDIDFPLSFMVGSPSLLLTDDLESGTGNFTLEGLWGPTGTTYHSASTSLTDTPSGDYSDQTAYSAVLDGSYPATSISFWHRYSIESGWDYGRFQVSANGGSWNTLASYTGNQSTWQQVSFDLETYAGQDLRFRWMMETDYSITYDGWYIDDIQITGAGSDNLAPATPVAISPLEGASVTSPPTLTVGNVTDPEGQPVVYGFRIYSDALCTQLAASADDLTQGDGQTSWTAPGLEPGSYYWRAYAGDGVERSLLSAPVAFTVSGGASPVDDLVITGPVLKILDRVSGGGARVQLGVPGTSRVTVDVYDLRGLRVRQLYNGVMDAGVRVLTWDGRDDSGRSTASGVYFLRMNAEGRIATGRVVVVR